MSNKKKMGLTALILMIFTSVYGFTNMTRSFYMMGYSAIPWFILAGLLFFIPYAFIVAEYGAAFKDEEGGIYTWMARSSGPKFAFMGTFLWYASYVIWLVGIGSGPFIVLSHAIFGIDRTQEINLFGLGYTKSIGIMGLILLTVLTYLSTKGTDRIKKVASVGGTFVIILNVFLWVGAVIVLIMNKGTFLEPITLEGFFKSPNTDFLAPIAVLGFVVNAIFSYGGLEVVGGVVDETENPEKTFPKAIMLSAIFIIIMYSLGILLFGAVTNWTFTYTQYNDVPVTLGNHAYLTMNQLGYQLGQAFSLSEEVSRAIGLNVARFMGISMFFGVMGAFFTLVFSPLKQLIGGTPKELWPESWTVKKDGIYINALKWQTIIVLIIFGIVSFGGEDAKQFFEVMLAMSNVAMTLPNVFIAYSFIKFKENESIHKPFSMFKSMAQVKLSVYIVCVLVLACIFFTVISPAIQKGDWLTTIMSVAGPLFFAGLGNILFKRAEKKMDKIPVTVAESEVLEDNIVE